MQNKAFRLFSFVLICLSNIMYAQTDTLITKSPPLISVDFPDSVYPRYSVFQLQDTSLTDSVWIQGRTIISIGDSSMFIERDTILLLPDSIADLLQKDRRARSDEFYRNLKKRFDGNRFTRELYNLIFTDVPSESPAPKQQISNHPSNKYSSYLGRKIHRIRIRNLNVLGTDFNDTTVQVDMWAINLANKLHISTRESIIKNNLFFKVGDTLEADILYDSERILRALPYIKDARIYIIPHANDSSKTDVLVLVKDIWSIGGGVNFVNINNFSGTIEDKNFLGWGHEFRNKILYTKNFSPEVGYEGTYTINNISRSFVTGQFVYANSEPFSTVGFSLRRDFITPEIRHAGGLQMATQRRLLGYEIKNEISNKVFIDYNVQDLWFGRSFQLEGNDNSRRNFQMAARTSRVRYVERPLVREDTNQLFFSYNRYLLSIGYAKRAYERGRLITGYGRTEDIPLGFVAEITAGREYNDFYIRNYGGIRFSYGDFLRRMGYVRPTLTVGGFFRDSHIEQGIFKPELDYFSNLYRYGRYNLRHFLKLTYTKGFGRFDAEFININNDNGIRGLNHNLLRGTERLALKYEGVLFTPAYFLGFRLAVFTFMDMGLINANNPDIFKNNIYQGYGVGFRLRNENLVFKTFQIRLAWYPVTPSGMEPWGFEISDESSLNLPDFRVERPAVLGFH